MEDKAKKKQIWIFVGGCLLTLAVVVAIFLLMRHYTLNHIDISQAHEVLIVTKDELVPLDEEETANIIGIFTDAEAYPDNISLVACPFDVAFLFRLADRSVLMSYSSDDCGVIRMQPVDMGSLTFWFKGKHQQEHMQYLTGIYQKYGLD